MSPSAVEATAKVSVVRLDERHDAAVTEDRVAVEAPLEIRLGAKPLTVIMRTPGDDEELTLGFLYSEGVLRRLGEAVRLHRPAAATDEEQGNLMAVELPPHLYALRPPGRSFYASASCGVCGKTQIGDLRLEAPPVSASWRARAGLLATLPEALAAQQRTFAATGGLHASALFSRDGALLAAREDVGRHNAVDKLIGWSYRQALLPLAEHLLMVSGRLGFEIVQKAIVAGLPVVAAVSAPSSLAVELAGRYGVTLIGFLRPGRMNVYTHPERVELA